MSLPSTLNRWGRGKNVLGTMLLITNLIVGILGAVRPAQAASFLVDESFTGSTAPGWVLGGSAYLTSGKGDPAGQGWLRLTEAKTSQAGFAYYDTPIPSGRGLVITFDYAAWGGTGADGLSFFLFDGTTTSFKVGASGGSLGYAQKKGVNGLSGGYLGLGLDEFGNYSNPTEGRIGGPGFIPHAVAVRGPGSGTSGYLYLDGTTNLTKSPWNLPRLDCPRNSGSCGDGSVRPSPSVYFRQVKITVSPVGAAYRVSVALKFEQSGEWIHLFGPFTMPTSAPGTLKMGFAASTGASTNYHEIRNLTVEPQVADLTATKAVQNLSTGGGSVAPGEELLYTVVLKNHTPLPISNVSFTDPIPQYTTYIANSATIPTGSVLQGTDPISITNITVPANGQETISFKVRVNQSLPAGVTVISNQGSFTYNSVTSQTDGDSVQEGNQPTLISVTAGPNFDTSTKTVTYEDRDNNREVSPGDILTYRVVLTNSGNQDASPVEFVDPLPSNSTYVSDSATVSSGSVRYNSTTKTLNWTVDVGAGTSQTLEFKVTVNSGVKIRDVISNQGTINLGSNRVLTDADLSTPGKQPTVLLVGGQATLSATKTAAVLTPPLKAGGILEYTVELANTGSYSVSGATFVDTMPANTTYVENSATTTSGNIAYNAPTLSVTGIDLASGATAIIKFRVRLNDPLPDGVAQISNQGVVSWDANQSGANNTSLNTDGDVNTPGQQPTITTIPNADLSVAKTVDKENPAEGETITYTVQVVNNGPLAASNVVVTDTLPSGLSLISVSASKGTYDSPRWTVGVLDKGESATLTMTASVELGQGGRTIENSSSVGSELHDANPANNQASAAIAVKVTSLRGTITDKLSGEKLSGVTVQVTDSQSHVCTATTNAQGEYVFASGSEVCILSAGSASVEIIDAPLGYLLTSTSLTLSAGEDHHQDFALVRPSLSGVVREAGSGMPISGAIVTLTQGTTSCQVTSGEGGAYQFVSGSMPTNCVFTPGDANVSASANHYQADSRDITILADGPTTQDLELKTANLLVLKDDGRNAVSPCEVLTYTITVSNTGSLTATSVTITETLSSYLTLLSDTSGKPRTNPSAGVYVWSLGDLPAGSSFVFNVIAEVAEVMEDGSHLLTNYVYVSTTNPEANITDNERSDNNLVIAHPDLTIFKSATSDSVPTTQGSVITYTYIGENKGSAIATNVRITDTLDVNTSYIDRSAVLVVHGQTWPVTATYTSTLNRLVLELPDMPVGAAGYLQYQAKVADTLPPGTTLITNTALVTSKEEDLNPNDNQSTRVISAQAGPNVYIQKIGIPSPNPATVGGQIIYRLRYGNLGNQAANNTTITDPIPAHTTLVPDSITGGGTASNGVITWNLASLAVGASGEVSFTVRINDTLPAGVDQILNTASITADNDLVDSDNQSQAILTVSAQPDLVIHKNTAETYFEAGQVVTYTLTYRNEGTQGATGVVITDTLDANLTYLSSSPSGTHQNGVVTWNIGHLEAGEQGSIQLTVRVSDDASGELILNRAVIADDGTNGEDLDPESNVAQSVVRVARPILTLEKSVTGQNYTRGKLTYTLSYINDGPISAHNVVISDTLPANTSLVAGSITGGGNLHDGVITWNLGDLPVGGSGTVSYTLEVGLGAGGAMQSAPTMMSDSVAGSIVLTSTLNTVGSPYCNASGCSTIRGYWGGSNPIGPAGWNANPQLAGSSFDDTAWSALTVPHEIEPYWTAAENLGAQWVAVNGATQYSRNYSFFRQYFYLPPNAHGFSGTLQIAGDDVVEIYVNGRYVGRHYGGGGATTHEIGNALLAGVNLLAIRLTNNTHNGHPIYNDGDHAGLLYRLEASYARTVPFVSMPTVTHQNQAVTFTIQPWLRGKAPFEYHIEFGDGQSSGYTPSTSFIHTYTQAGIYTVKVTARDALGSLATEERTITVLASGENLLANRAAIRYENGRGILFSGQSGAGITIEKAADLYVQKQVTHGGTTPGGSVTYQITVGNHGPDDLLGVVISDTLPSALTDVTWTCDAFNGGACGSPSGSGNPFNQSVNLPEDVSVTFTITATIDSAASGALENTAQVLLPQGVVDVELTDNRSSVRTDLIPSVSLSIQKSSTPKPGLTPGGRVTYTIIVGNAGPSDAVDVMVEDSFSSLLSDLTWTCSASIGSTCTARGSGDLADQVMIKAGGQLTYTVYGTVSASAEVGTVLTNTAAATYGTSSVSAMDENTLVASATLTATKDALDSSNTSSRSQPYVDGDNNGGVSPADTLKYRVTIYNSSKQPAYQVVYSDRLDPNTVLDVGSVVCEPGCTVLRGNSSGDRFIDAQINTLAGGGSVVLTYTLTVRNPLPFGTSVIVNQGHLSGANIDAVATDDPLTEQSGDATQVLLTMGSISGFTWLDDNGDSSKNASEVMFADVAITLLYAGPDGIWGTEDDEDAYSRTDSNGLFRFDALPAGKYRIGFQRMECYAFSPQGNDSLVDAESGFTEEIILGINMSKTAIAAGYVSQADFGNLPSAFANTRFVHNGARHIVDGQLMLGSRVDVESDGLEGVTPADNDGVQRVSGERWLPGATVHLKVTVTGGQGILIGWFDWDRDHQFEDGERVDFGVLPLGVSQVALTIPSHYNNTQNASLSARLRLYPVDFAQEFSPYGFAYGGEVEDYQWNFVVPTAVDLRGIQARPERASHELFFSILYLATLSIWFWKRKSG